MATPIDIVNSNRALQQAITEQITGNRPLPYVLAFRRQPTNPTLFFDTRLVNENNPLPSIVNIAFFVIKNLHSEPQEIDESLARHYISACQRERKMYVIEARCELLKKYCRQEDQNEFLEWRSYLLRDFPNATISRKLQQIMQETPETVPQMIKSEEILSKCCTCQITARPFGFLATIVLPPPIVTVLKILSIIFLRNRQSHDHFNSHEKTIYTLTSGSTFGSAIRFILDCTLLANRNINYTNIFFGIANNFLSTFIERNFSAYARTIQHEFEVHEAEEVRLTNV